MSAYTHTQIHTLYTHTHTHTHKETRTRMHARARARMRDIHIREIDARPGEERKTGKRPGTDSGIMKEDEIGMF